MATLHLYLFSTLQCFLFIIRPIFELGLQPWSKQSSYPLIVLVFHINVDRYIFHSCDNLGSLGMPAGRTASFREEREGTGWSLVSLSNHQAHPCLHLICIQFTFKIMLNQMVAQLLNLDTTVFIQSWLCRAFDSPGILHGYLGDIESQMLSVHNWCKTCLKFQAKEWWTPLFPRDNLETSRLLFH